MKKTVEKIKSKVAYERESMRLSALHLANVKRYGRCPCNGADGACR